MKETESNLKAVFIYNFIKYIDWDYGDVDDDFVIGVLGSTDVTEALTEIAKTHTAKHKKITIRHFNKPEEITPCNILFISANSGFSLPSVLANTSKGTLTITEEAGLAEQGAAFNFVVIKDKLKFEANVKSINAAGLKASSQLLKLAIIVD